MNIKIIWVGKTSTSHINIGIEDYANRIKHYTNFDIITIPDLKATKNLTEAQQRDKEGELILKHLKNEDFVVLLDDKGKEMTSLKFAKWIEQKQHASIKNLYFIIGGAYGFSQAIYDRSNALLSLSKMTFSHQIIRLIFAEQLYRAFTILKNEPYHHEDSLLNHR